MAQLLRLPDDGVRVRAFSDFGCGAGACGPYGGALAQLSRFDQQLSQGAYGNTQLSAFGAPLATFASPRGAWGASPGEVYCGAPGVSMALAGSLSPRGGGFSSAGGGAPGTSGQFQIQCFRCGQTFGFHVPPGCGAGSAVQASCPACGTACQARLPAQSGGCFVGAGGRQEGGCFVGAGGGSIAFSGVGAQESFSGPGFGGGMAMMRPAALAPPAQAFVSVGQPSPRIGGHTMQFMPPAAFIPPLHSSVGFSSHGMAPPAQASSAGGGAPGHPPRPDEFVPLVQPQAFMQATQAPSPGGSALPPGGWHTGFAPAPAPPVAKPPAAQPAQALPLESAASGQAATAPWFKSDAVAPAPPWSAPAPPSQNSYNASYGQASTYGAGAAAQVPWRPPRPSGRRRALLIGVNYVGTPGELRGCINDVYNLKKLLEETYGWSSQDISILTDDGQGSNLPTRVNIEQQLSMLVAGASPGDVFFLSFAGHGAQQRDPEGLEEDGMNETFLPMDYQEAGMITDNRIKELVITPLPDGSRLTCVMDCCHSGTGLDLPFTWDLRQRSWREQANPEHAVCDVIMFSGCEDADTSADAANQYGSPGGAMTSALCAVLRRCKSPSWPQLLEMMRSHLAKSGFPQQPVLSATQQFKFDRAFSLDDIRHNTNKQLGRQFRQKYPPRPRRLEGPLAEMLGAAGMLPGAPHHGDQQVY